MTPPQPYPSDVTDQEWKLIRHLVPSANAGSCPEKHPKREILISRRNRL